MTFPLYCDEDILRTPLHTQLTRLGWSVRITTQEGNAGLADDLQLQWATERSLAVLTSNQKDFARIHKEWVAVGRSHAGIIVLTDQRTGIGDLIRGLSLMAERLDSLASRIEFLAEWIRAARGLQP